MSENEGLFALLYTDTKTAQKGAARSVVRHIGIDYSFTSCSHGAQRSEAWNDVVVRQWLGTYITFITEPAQGIKAGLSL